MQETKPIHPDELTDLIERGKSGVLNASDTMRLAYEAEGLRIRALNADAGIHRQAKLFENIAFMLRAAGF